MTRRLGLALVLAASSLFVVGDQSAAPDITSGSFMIRYDVDSTTTTYCREEGLQGAITLGLNSGPARIKTAGSSTSVTSDTASSASLSPVAARDIIAVKGPTNTSEPFAAGFAAVIISKADNDNVTVDPAVNWTGGFAYTYYKTVCGTTDNDGWQDVSGATRISLHIQYEQGDLDALAWQFQCKHPTLGTKPEIVYPSESDGCGNAGTQVAGFCEFATAGSTASFTLEEFGAWASCRIGFKVKTTDASDAGAALERVTGSIIISKGSN